MECIKKLFHWLYTTIYTCVQNNFFISHQMEMNPEDDQIGCGYCSKKRRVLNAYELKIGQHICEPGRHTLKYKEKKHSTKAFYNHHAIIAEIKERTDYQVTLVLIHYTDVTGFKRGVIKKTEEKRDLKYHEIYLVEYNFAKYTPEEIVCRAESQVKDEGNDAEKTKDTENNVNNDHENHDETNEAIDSKRLDADAATNEENRLHVFESVTKDIVGKQGFASTEDNQSNGDKNVFGDYNLFKSNCEHFATWCVLGKQKCFQLDQKSEVFLFPFNVSSLAAGVFSLIISSIFALFASMLSEDQTSIPSFSLLGVVSIYIIYLFISFINLYRNHKYKYLCSFCFKGKSYKLLTRLIWCIIPSTMTYMIMQMCFQLMCILYVTILTNMICVLISACTQWLYKGFKSPFVSNYSKADELSNIKKGDVIVFRQYGFCQFAIATEVTLDTCTISVVHYKGFFINKVIIEEEIKWPGVTIWTLDLGKMTRFSTEEVISRVRQRLGESKWRWRLNRSDHVCYWAIKKQLHLQYYSTWTTDQTTQTSKDTIQITDKTTWTTQETTQTTDKTTWTTKETTQTSKEMTQTTEETTETTEETDTKSKDDQIFSSFEVEKIQVNLRNEIETGDVVELLVKREKVRQGRGIVIEIQDSADGLLLDSRSFQLCIVMQERRYVTKSWINIDLNTDTVEVKKFHPVHSHSMEERKKRALSISANEKKDRKSNLVEYCVLKENRNTCIAVCDIEEKKYK